MYKSESKIMSEIRNKIINHIAKRLNAIIPDTPMVDVYKNLILNMSDKELDDWITSLENGEQDISLIVPNLNKKQRLDITRNLKLAKEMGVNFFERLWLTNPVTGQTYLTNRKYMTLLLPVKRQAQTLDTKISLAADDKTIDDLTGQVTGESKGSSISYAEIQMLEAQGLSDTLYELLKARGGDEEAWRLMKRQLIQTGEFDTDVLDTLDTRAKVNDTLNSLLKGMHIANNI